MITSKQELLEYLEADKRALGITHKRPKMFRDEIWRFQILLRRCEYTENCNTILFSKVKRMFNKFAFHRMSVRLGFSIPLNVIGKGLSIAHYGTIVINSNAKIGEFCRIQESVTIGATNGQSEAPIIGDYCFIGSGARIIGNIRIADNVSLGANTVVTKDIVQSSTTYAGVPAIKISDVGANSNLIIKYEVKK